MLRWTWIAVLGGVLFSRANLAQQFVPARAGLIARSQGRVLLNEHAIGEILEGLSPLWEVREGGNLRTESGRVAVFLTPEALLFVAEDTQLELLSSRFTDVRLRLIYGSAIAEVYVPDRFASITLLARDIPVELRSPGVYQFLLAEGKQQLLQVFAGQAIATTSSGGVRVKRKSELNLESGFAPRKLETRGSDILERWERRRRLAMRSAGGSDATSAVPWWITPGISIYP